MSARRFKGGLAWLAPAVAIAALLMVYLAYLNPHTALDLANRIWACF